MSYTIFSWLVVLDIVFRISSFLYFLSNFESRMIHPGLRSERYIGSRTQNLSFDQTKTQVTWLESYNRQELHILHGHMGSLSVLDGASVAYHFHFLCCVVVFCVNLLSFSCVLCAQRCQCFWIVLFWLHLRVSLTFISITCS